MAHWVILPLGMLVFLIRVLIDGPSPVFPVQLLANTIWKVADDGLRSWVPIAHVGGPDGGLASWLWFGPILSVRDI